MASHVARRFFTTSVRQLSQHGKEELKKETKRNPELLVRHKACGGSKEKGQMPAD